MKVLLLGFCDYSLIRTISRNIKKHVNAEIHVLDLCKTGLPLTASEKAEFDGLHYRASKRIRDYSIPKILQASVKIIFSASFIKQFLAQLIRFRFLAIKNAFAGNVIGILYKNERDSYGDEMRAFFSGFDIFHFHFISPDNLYDLNFIPAGKKIILSFWGSDLYSLNGTTDYSIQYKAVERADIVTLHSNEMRSVFLEKFGSDKLNKTRLTLFGINEDRLDLLSGFKKNAVSDNFRKKYKIQQQIVIMLGYSAAEGQQHLPVLEVLGRMPEEIKQHIVLFIPLSYNSENRGYVKNVLSCIRQVPLTCIPVTDYLSDAEMLELISNTQIMLNVRETDAMNNAMVECLYNGTLVINGSWLPYSRLKQQQVYFAEVDHVEELRTVLPRLINTISTELEKCKGNEAKIRAMMSGEVIIKDWAAIYAGI